MTDSIRRFNQPRQWRGQLFYIIGPSGAGKDTLINGLRLRLSAEDNCLICHRYITRPPEARGENHIWLTEEEFGQRVALGSFSLHWAANGLRYGIGSEIDNWLAAGCNVVVNGSRGYLETAQQRYGAKLVPVLIDVASQTLKQRLEARGRESAEQIAQRLQRSEQLREQMPQQTVRIDNNGEPVMAIEQLLTLIQSYNPVAQQH